MLPSCQPEVGDLIPASCLQLAAGAHVGHEAVQPHTQQCTWMVGRRSQQFSIRLHTQFCPVLPVQRIHELGHEPCRMVRRDQFVKGRRQIAKPDPGSSLEGASAILPIPSLPTFYTLAILPTFETGSITCQRCVAVSLSPLNCTTYRHNGTRPRRKCPASCFQSASCILSHGGSLGLSSHAGIPVSRDSSDSSYISDPL